MKAYRVRNNHYYACTLPNSHRFPNCAQNSIGFTQVVEGALAAAITLAAVVITLVLLTL